MELPRSFGTCRDVRNSGEDELCEELEPERGLELSSEATGRLAEDALA